MPGNSCRRHARQLVPEACSATNPAQGRVEAAGTGTGDTGAAGSARRARSLITQAKTTTAPPSTTGTPLDVLTDAGRQCLLAVGMNGEPLPLEHGFPVRMVVPGLYGYVSATKWVVQLKVTTFAADEGYWTPLGWSAKGPIKLASRIDVPTRAADAGTVVVAGVAWAQHTGISAVEVQVDDGPWARAELAETTGPDTWRQWRYAWDATLGDHRIAVRATDAKGTLQDPAEAAPAPDGSSGYHSVRVSVS